MARQRSVPLLLLVALSGAAHAVPAAAQADGAGLDRYLTAQAADHGFHGSVLVTRGGKVLLRKGYGFANLELRVPNAPEAKFRIGSVTKQFTAMAIMILQEQGKLKVQDQISVHLADLPAAWKPLTIHQLLSHTSGLMHSWELPGFSETMMVPSTMAATLERFRDRPLLSTPGTKYHYSGLGYFLLAGIIERASGLSYGDFLQQQIFGPLGMRDTGEDRQGPILANRASGYRPVEGGFENDTPIDMPLLTGGGNLYSTIDDLGKWDRALAAGKLISKSSYEAMYTPVLNNYGYGWIVARQADGKRALSHSGGTPGFRAVIRRFVDDDTSIIILSNVAGQQLGPITRQLTESLGLRFGQ